MRGLLQDGLQMMLEMIDSLARQAKAAPSVAALVSSAGARAHPDEVEAGALHLSGEVTELRGHPYDSISSGMPGSPIAYAKNKRPFSSGPNCTRVPTN